MSSQEAFSFPDVGPADASAVDPAVASAVEPTADPFLDPSSLVEIRTSSRRRRTVTAYREGDRTIVLVPSRMSVRERERYAAELVERLNKREARTRRSDDDLMARSALLSEAWLGGQARPAGVRWVGNQRSRWGSCTPVDGTIRLSDRMRGMPSYVIDAVLLHELAHLVHADHGPEFWALLAPHPDQERAKSYLEGAIFGQTHLRDAPPPDPELS